MKRYLPSILAVILLLSFAGFRFAKNQPRSSFALNDFGRIPVNLNGRILPWESVARDSLLKISSSFYFSWTDSNDDSAISWLLEVMTKPNQAADRQIFTVTNPRIQSNLKRRPADSEEESNLSLRQLIDLGPDPVYYSYNELGPYLERIDIQASGALEQSLEARDDFQKSIINLSEAITLYESLSHSLFEGSASLVERIANLEDVVEKGNAAMAAREAGKAFEEEDYTKMMETWYEFEDWEQKASVMPILTTSPSGETNWSKMSTALDMLIQDGRQNEIVAQYAIVVDAVRENDPNRFNEATRTILTKVSELDSSISKKAFYEHFFDAFQPFSTALWGYLAGFLFAMTTWIRPSSETKRIALSLIISSAALHLLGVVLWLIIIGDTVVFNLHSSAILMSLISVLIALGFESRYRSGIYFIAASLAAVVALFVAEYQSLHGDAFAQVSAIKDSNIWLQLYHIAKNVCFAFMFTAGSVGVIWISKSVFTDTVDSIEVSETTKTFNQLTTVALYLGFFAVVFESLNSNLDSGTFWRWDKAENGLLTAVAWCLIVTQCRWQNMLRPRANMMLAVCGNLIAAWAFIGWVISESHVSYSLTGSVSFILFQVFMAANLLFVLLTLLPLKFWRSGNAIAYQET